MRLNVLLVLALAAACGGDGDGSLETDGGPGSDSGVPPDPSDSVFDESQIQTFNLTIADADWDFLNENALLEQYVPGTLEYDGETVAEIGVRYKGAVGSLRLCFDQQGNRICDKLSFKLKFNEYVPGQRLRGLKRVNLHAMEGDGSKMHDAIGYKLFRDNGVYASRTAFARVVVNGELIGLFIAVEAVDGRFTRRSFPDGGEGNLYKEIWPVYSSSQPYINALRTNEDENPSVDKILGFAAALAAADDSTFEAMIEAWTDADMLMRYMAVARLLDHWDGIVAFYCGSGGGCGNHNYYWYESQSEDKLWLVPWDLDHTFEDPNPFRDIYGMPEWDDVDADCTPRDVFLGVQARAPGCDPLIRGMAVALGDRYVAESRELLAGDFSAAALSARIDALEALIADEIANDPDVTPAEWSAAVANLRNNANSNRAFIESRLP